MEESIGKIRFHGIYIDIKQLGHNVIEMNLKGVQHNILPYMESLQEEVEHSNMHTAYVMNRSNSLRLISARKKNCYGKFHSFLFDQRHSNNVSAEAHGGHLVMQSVKQENQLNKFVTKM